jgi:hypothetical protein
LKISEAIHLAGLVEKGNVMEEELAILWLGELDGMIQTDIMLCSPEDVVSYTSTDNELLLKPPHDRIYVHYLVMMIRQQQQEYEGYNNAQAIVEEKLSTFRRWYVQHYRPADSLSDNGAVSDPGTWGFAYITAYGLAVQQGYRGTLEEWLESLKGETGEAARMRYNEERETVQWGTGEQWYDLFTLRELRDPAVDAIIAQATAAAESAAGSAQAAQGEAQKAQQSMERAGLSAQNANTAAEAAEAAREGAETAAEDAEAQAAAAKRSEENSRANLHDAEVAAQDARAAAERAEEAAANGGQGGAGNGTGHGPLHIASDEPPEDVSALWIDTSEPDEAVALGATVVETEAGVEICATDELGTTRATVRHGRDGAPGTTPVKGVDYFTPADVQKIAAQAAEMVDVPDVAAGGIPFSNVTTRLIVDVTITPDEEGVLPTFIEITQRDDGTPLNLKAFVFQTDIKSNVSYTVCTYNDNGWQSHLPGVGHGEKGKSTTVILTKDGSIMSSVGLFPVGSNSGLGELKKAEAINKLKIPGTMAMSAGTFFRLWEITGV